LPAKGGTFLFATTLIDQVPEALSQAVKQPELESDHSHPFSAEVKNSWSCTSTLQGMVFHVVKFFRKYFIKMTFTLVIYKRV
jgi:hypothetical protein